MRTIISKNIAFSSLFGEKSSENDKSFVLAPYCLIVPCNDGTLVYNSLSRELILLDNEELRCLENINTSKSTIADYLKKQWFFIPRNKKGIVFCDQMHNTMKIMQNATKDNYYTHFTIMTTLECNARCFYCFQKGRVQPRMSLKTAEDVAKFIIKQSPPGKKVFIAWFGGEPLFNIDAINTISDHLKKYNKTYVSTIISNGYLFTDDVIKTAVNKWNTKKVQITLDGTEDIYNRSKNYIYSDCDSPFMKVIGNIENLLKNDINVSVRLNLGVHNSDDLYKLIDYLIEKFNQYEKFTIYAHRLFDYDEFGNQIYKDDDIVKTINSFNNFIDYLAERDVSSNKQLTSDYTLNRCMADFDRAVVITPDGNLTKCEHFSDKEIIGDIYSNVNTNIINSWKELQPRLDICEDCPAYIDCLRLKKCPDIAPRCDIYQKNEKIHQLKLKILNTYNKWKENTGDGSVC